ncbi:MAG: helix-turn-helix transcriptional regulator [Candidatus Omnitrophica bacterium]|nr:helix-turn-helix transcriptional regulator [Candidatus Omnitrophota bacterium]
MQNSRGIKKILVTNIKKYRARRKLTQEQAAKLAGITAKYWQRLEMTSQTDLPSLKVIFKVADALKINPSKLIA